MTLAGAGLAALGLVLVLDLLSGADLSIRGVLWALGAMVGCATYFIIIGDDDNGLPPIVLASAGWWSAPSPSHCSGLVGLLPMHASTAPRLTPAAPLLVAAAGRPGPRDRGLSYVAGVAAGRLLGSRLASFVALTEVVASVCWAWLLLDELPGRSSCRAAC